MSRYYEMNVYIDGYDPEKLDKIKEVADKEWDFEFFTIPLCNNETPRLNATGRDNLCGGESEEEFAQRLTAAVWKANEKFCKVEVFATYLENLPFETYILDEEDYKAWKKKKKEKRKS